jgi:phosphatidylethanolamine/phosphatidyl-N-methylethanolamine N-methyltransferase
MAHRNGFSAFLKAALRDPMKVSTVFPSLRFLAQSLIKHSGMKPGQHVLELGCGSGAVTQHILKQSQGLASYTGVEIDENLVAFLQSKYPEHRFICASAGELKEHIADHSMDTIICTLPWTLFPLELQQQIVNEIIRILKPGGTFVTFLCLHALTYPGAPRIKKIFRATFQDFKKSETISLNIPPANVYRGSL